jgi:hypothetical protein
MDHNGFCAAKTRVWRVRMVTEQWGLGLMLHKVVMRYNGWKCIMLLGSVGVWSKLVCLTNERECLYDGGIGPRIREYNQ